MPQSAPQLSQSDAPFRSQKVPPRSSLAEATSEKATIALIRKTLCPQSITAYGSGAPQPLEELLPPLTSSNELDLQLYALIAIIIKEFVYVWYSKITPDHVFVDEVVQLIAHSTRALEQRFRQIDVEQVILDEIPRLIEAHIIAYRTAKDGSQLVSFPTSIHEIYHTLNPHPALSPVPDPSIPHTPGDQRDNEVAYQHLLAQSVLAVLLPTEDLGNTCLRTLVSDILADRILDNEVTGKICHGPFLWEMVSKLISLVKRKEGEETRPKEAESTHTNRLERFGLLSARAEPLGHDSPTKSQSHLAVWMWRILQAIYLGSVAFRFVVRELFLVAPLVPSIPPPGLSVSSTSVVPGDRLDTTSTSARKIDSKRPVLDYRIFSMSSQLVETSKRMPWLQALISLLQYLALSGPGKVGETDNILDRFLRETIRKFVLTPTFIPTLLIAIRSSLFPMNARPESIASNADPAPTSSKLVSTTPSAASLSPSSPDATNLKEKANDGSGISSAPKLLSPKVQASQTFAPDVALEAPTPGNASPMTNNEHRHAVHYNSMDVTERDAAAAAAAIKRQCAQDLLSLIPRPIARLFFHITANETPAEAVTTALTSREIPDQQDKGQKAPTPEQGNVNDQEESLILNAIENDILDPFADTYCNKHLIFSIIETILVRLLPELAEQSVTELMEERGVSF